MSHVNGWRKILDKFHGKKSPESWRKICIKKHPRGVMFPAGISAFGPTATRFVPPDTKVNANFYLNKVVKFLFGKGHSPSVWEGRQFCHAAPRQRPSTYGRGQCPVARKLRLQFYSCAGLAHWFSRFVAHGLFIEWNFQAPTLEAEGTQSAGTEAGYAPRVVKSVCWSLWKRFLPGNPVWNLWFRVMAFRLNTWGNLFFFDFLKWEKTK